MTDISISVQFARRKVPLSWADLLWAYKRALLTWKDLIDVAADKVSEGSNDFLETEIANADKESVWKVSELAQKLAERVQTSDDEVKKKWLFLTLAWVYENRAKIADPLGVVEGIYADFDYPQEVESFVRYMPPADGYVPAKHSQEDNHLRLMGKWNEFLSDCSLGPYKMK